MKTREIIEEAREWLEGPYGQLCAPSTFRVMGLLKKLAERVEALESREEVRHRIEPTTRGERPEKGVGGT